MSKSKYMISVETRTLAVYAVDADRPLDASIEFGRQLADGLQPVHSSILSVKYGAPQVAVADPAASAQADVQSPHDDQHGQADHDTKNEPADSAHGVVGTQIAAPPTPLDKR